MSMAGDGPPGGDLRAGQPAQSWVLRMAVMIAAHAFGTACALAPLGMGPSVKASFGLTWFEVGLMHAAYTAGQMAFGMPSGVLVDRFGVRRSLILSHVLLGAGALAVAFAPGFGWVLPAMSVMGAGYSLSNPATAKAVLIWFSPARRATAMGAKQTGVPLGGLLVAASGALATVIPWQHVMLIAASLAAVGVLTCLPLREAPAEGGRRTLRDIGAGFAAVFRNANLNVVNAHSVLLNIGQQNVYAYMTLFMTQAVGLPQSLAAGCLGAVHAGSAVGRTAWGVVSDGLFAGRRMMPTVAMGVGAGAAFVALALMTPGTPLLVAALVAFVLGVTICSYAGLSQVMVIESVAPRHAGAAMGYNFVFAPLGGMVGAPLFGEVADRTGAVSNGWLLAAAAAFAGSLLLLVAYRETRIRLARAAPGGTNGKGNG